MSENLRETKKYKELDSYMACAIAEGFCEGEGASEEEQLIAWQWLLDTGLCWKLQGWFGRTVMMLLEDELIEKPEKGVKNENI